MAASNRSSSEAVTQVADGTAEASLASREPWVRDIVCMMEPPFDPPKKPAVILDETGRWLARRLGFRWLKSYGELRRSEGDQILRVYLQSSSWSRAGVATWVSPRVMVEDAGLAQWRSENLGSTAEPRELFRSRAFNSLTINISEFNQLDLSGQMPIEDISSNQDLPRFTKWLEEVAIPAVDLFDSPSALAAGLPDAWLPMADASVVELALSRGDRDAARLLVERIVLQPVP